MDQKTQSPPTAKPAGISLYDRQIEFLERKKLELEKATGKPASKSKIVQMLIEEAEKKEGKK